jgi:hypothetical protein
MPVHPLVDRLALHGVPVAAGVITAVMLLGPARERPALGARVDGYPVVGSERVSFRVATLEHRAEGYRDVALEGVRVDLRDAGGILGSAEVAAGEVVVPLLRPLAGSARVRVSAGEHVLADGELTAHPLLDVSEPPAYIEESRAFRLSVVVTRGQLLPEFPETLRVEVSGPSLADPRLVAEARGGDARVVAGPTRRCQDERCRFDWSIEATARSPSLEVELTVRDGDAERARASTPLPVLPGGVWLDPTRRGNVVSLRSSIAREPAYLSVVGPHGRVWGTQVAMALDDSGFAGAEVALPLVDFPSVRALRVSSDATEPDDATVSWPLGRENVAAGALDRIADGMPAAIAAERERRAAARRPAFGLVLAAAVFELGYLAWRARRSRRDLASRLDPALLEAPLSAVSVALAGGAIALLFVALALLVAFG